jgi:adenylate kinase family enzyme
MSRNAVANDLEQSAGSRMLTQTLRKVFGALEVSGITYCVMRDFEQLLVEEADKEIDLIVDRKVFPSAKKVLEDLGFVETPSWGHEPHRFFVTYLPEIGMWLKLDIVTELRFGKPVSCFGSDLLASMVAHRIYREWCYALAPEDELLLLLIKGVVNDSGVRPSRAETLKGLWRQAKSDPERVSRLDLHLTEYFGSSTNGNRTLDRLDNGDWQWFESRRAFVIKSLRARQPVRTLYRYLRTRFMGFISPLLYAVFRRGTSVALLAPDGAGKSTLATHLLAQKHLRARLIYMGINLEASVVGLPTTPWFRKHANGAGGISFKRIVARAFNFPNTLLEQWYRSLTGFYYRLRGRTVVYDRYVYDTWLNPRPTKLLKRLRRFLIERTCPDPDIVILLDAPGTVLFSRKHEHDVESLEKKRQAYLEVSGRIPNLHVVDATGDLRAVTTEATSIVWNSYCNRNPSPRGAIKPTGT